MKVLYRILKIWIRAEQNIGSLRFAQLIENYHTQINDPYHFDDERFLKSLLKFYTK